MNQPSRSQSIDHKDSYRGGDYGQDDRRDNNYGDNDGRYNNSRSPGGRGSPEPVNSNSGNVLYVGNLSRRTTEDNLKELFEKYGKVDKIDMIKDPFTHECRGFAFIAYIDGRDATDAMENLDQKEFDGRKMKVEKSKRGVGYQKTPGEYLGQFKSYNRPHSGSPSRRRDFRGGRRSRERYHRDRSPRERSPRDPRDRPYHHRDDRDFRDRERERYRRSRSRSYGRGDRDRDGGYHPSRRYGGGDRGGYRERSFSRDRYRNDRYRGGDRERSRSKGRR